MACKNILLKAVSMILVLGTCEYGNLLATYYADQTPELVENILELRAFLNNDQAIQAMANDELIIYLLDINPDVLAVVNDTFHMKWAVRLQNAIDKVLNLTIRAQYLNEAANVENVANQLRGNYLDEDAFDALDNENTSIYSLEWRVSDFLLASRADVFEKWNSRITKALNDARINGDKEAYIYLLNHKNERTANVRMLRDVISPVSKR